MTWRATYLPGPATSGSTSISNTSVSSLQIWSGGRSAARAPPWAYGAAVFILLPLIFTLEAADSYATGWRRSRARRALEEHPAPAQHFCPFGLGFLGNRNPPLCWSVGLSRWRSVVGKTRKVQKVQERGRGRVTRPAPLSHQFPRRVNGSAFSARGSEARRPVARYLSGVRAPRAPTKPSNRVANESIAMVHITDDTAVAVPARAEIPLFRVYVAPDAAAQTTKTLNSGYITQGPRVEEFEEKMSAYLQNPYTLTLNSATSGRAT